ncbi:type II toxin-antitoxin system YhaV family toxin [Ectothiorhodospira variabilis]|uniref:type II toxin-antitoxin system YhaV family toxin n=1 Tax=Ectothiorhodospira variabilis TaxID=505694 RepID=UPI001EFBBB05|nr:type II toxin-antitoxin system YhaV family toxin [Ectothiorhodospira variabilis]MCG5493634.1 type II toxin-antitoxin system YhaV family toxin [Ectothiorhodospira variabilis]MCG5502963.1 type II toxin-antitoxin system YhaV family toxin [Ectothiorhodospira variabilis]MCG5506249.1 type II toxin-antitoxin system YhaV family toxin [Ectothiorhodospira variabilis]
MTALKVNGWTIYAHPLFIEQVEMLTEKVKRLQEKDPVGYRGKPATKRLAAIVKLALNDIPQDPSGPQHRQGNTLGTEHSHWRRAKFYQQCRLFFRYDLASRIIVYAWVNDESTKRAYDSKHDAYAVFQKMLREGHPPDGWQTLREAAKSHGERFRALLGAADDDR